MGEDRIWYGRKAKVVTIALVVSVVLLGMVPLAHALMSGEGLMWTVWSSEPVKLVVCWENPSTADATAREWVRLALKRSWERYTRVIFVGWAQCQGEGDPATPPHTLGPRRPGTLDENLKVQVRTTGGGQNPGHGSWGDYQQTGIWLNLSGTRAQVEHLAIHEFGHALGYYHGEERTDWPSTPQCPEQWSGHTPSDPWWPIPTERRYGSADEDSVMAYCSGTSTALSPKDIAGAQRYYQRHLRGTTLNAAASLCLAAHAVHGDGDPVFGWACDEALDDQEWKYDWTDHSLHIAQPATPATWRCLDVDTNNYTDVQTWTCNQWANQQWRFRRVLLRGYGGLCLTRPNRGVGPVTMQTCTGADTQLWRLDDGDQWGSVRIKAETANRCLAASGSSMSSVVATYCEGTFQIYLPVVAKRQSVGSAQNAEEADAVPQATEAYGQDFFMIGGGQIRLPSVGGGTQYCFDVQDVWDYQYRLGEGGPTPGQRVQTFECLASQLNQRWNLTGDIVSVNKCLTLDGDNTNNGANAIVEGCNNSVDQDWDYYW